MEPKEIPQPPVEQADNEQASSSRSSSLEEASGTDYTIASIAEEVIAKSFSELGLDRVGAIPPPPEPQQQQRVPFRAGILKGISSQIPGPPLKKRVHFAENNLETIWEVPYGDLTREDPYDYFSSSSEESLVNYALTTKDSEIRSLLDIIEEGSTDNSGPSGSVEKGSSEGGEEDVEPEASGNVEQNKESQDSSLKKRKRK